MSNLIGRTTGTTAVWRLRGAARFAGFMTDEDKCCITTAHEKLVLKNTWVIVTENLMAMQPEVILLLSHLLFSKCGPPRAPFMPTTAPSHTLDPFLSFSCPRLRIYLLI